MTNLSDKILDKIKKQDIKPKSRLIFILKNYLFWSFFVLFLLLGSLSFAVIIHMFKWGDWDMYHGIGFGFFGFAINNLPYVWIVFLLVFIVIAYYNFKNTKKGYRYGLFMLIFISILASMFLGTTFYAFGMGRAIENSFVQHVPLYRIIQAKKAKIWQNPDKGFLAGKVTEIKDDNNFILKDLRGVRWGIHKIANDEFIVEKNQEIKMRGIKKADNVFEAEIIRPLFGRGCVHEHHHHFRK